MASIDTLGDSPLRWHLVFTKPSGEQIAKHNLERQGYRVYLPRLQAKTLTRAGWRETISALFPRYLFVQLDSAAQSLAPVRSTLGVANVVRFGTQFVSVPNSIVDTLMGRESESGFHHLAFSSGFKSGAAIRVVEGVLAGIEGIFERLEANDRVSVLLNLVGREASIKLPVMSIEPVC